MTSKALIVILIVALGVALPLSYFYYSSMQRKALVDISKQSSVVQNYLVQHPNATCSIWKSDGNWIVHWYDPTSFIPYIVNVLINGKTMQIINVEEAD